MVDSGELTEPGAASDPSSTDVTPNHFMVTGIDPVNRQVFPNDPAKTAPVIMPLDQFEAAWRDSGNRMLEVTPGGPAPTSTPDPGGPLVSVPTAPVTAPVPATVPGMPSPARPRSPAPAPTVPPAPLADGCCVLSMTLDVLASDLVAAVGAPPVPSAVAALGVLPDCFRRARDVPRPSRRWAATPTPVPAVREGSVPVPDPARRPGPQRHQRPAGHPGDHRAHGEQDREVPRARGDVHDEPDDAGDEVEAQAELVAAALLGPHPPTPCTGSRGSCPPGHGSRAASSSSSDHWPHRRSSLMSPHRTSSRPSPPARRLR